jgi:hypothetical protein
MKAYLDSNVVISIVKDDPQPSPTHSIVSS